MSAVDDFHRSNMLQLRPDLGGLLGARSGGPASAENWTPLTAGEIARDSFTPGTTLHTLNTEIKGYIDLACLKAAVGDTDGAGELVKTVDDWMADNREELYQTAMQARASKDEAVRLAGQGIFDYIYGAYRDTEVAVQGQDMTGAPVTQKVSLAALLSPKANGLARSFRERRYRSEGYGPMASGLMADTSDEWSALRTVPDLTAKNGEMMTKQSAAEVIASSASKAFAGEDGGLVIPAAEAVGVAMRVLRETGSAALPDFLSDIREMADARGISMADAAERWLSLHQGFYAQEAASRSPDGKGFVAGKPDATGYLTSAFRSVARSLYREVSDQESKNGARLPGRDELIRTAVQNAGGMARAMREFGVMVPSASMSENEYNAFAKDLLDAALSPDGSVGKPRSKFYRANELVRLAGQAIAAEPTVLDANGSAVRATMEKSPALAYKRASGEVCHAALSRMIGAVMEGRDLDTVSNAIRDQLAGDLRIRFGIDSGSAGGLRLSDMLADSALRSVSTGTALDLRGLLDRAVEEPARTENGDRGLAAAAGKLVASLDSDMMDVMLAKLINDTAGHTLGEASPYTPLFTQIASDMVKSLPPEHRGFDSVRRSLATLSAVVKSGSEISWGISKGEDDGVARLVVRGVGQGTPSTMAELRQVISDRDREMAENPETAGKYRGVASEVGYLIALLARDEEAAVRRKAAEKAASMENSVAQRARSAAAVKRINSD